ncbi:RNA polymerase sigma factor [Oceanobacillus sp. CAU 1775]
MKLEDLYKEVYPRIYAYLYLRVGNQPMAEDLVQEVFYHAIKNFHTFSSNSTIETWLFGIAKNRLRNFYRSKKYQEQLMKMAAEQKQTSESPEDQLMEKEKRKSLLETIHQLEELPKEIVTLRVYGELSLKEIAVLVNKSENHTRIIFHRAKLKIQKELDDDQDG